MTTASPEQTADLLLPLLQSALPSIVSCSIVDTIIQANAQGCRVSATHSSHDDSDDDDHHLFVKRIMASDYVKTKKTWNDYRRTLLYGRTEVRFYKEIMPLVMEKGFSVNMVPICHVAQCNLQNLIDDASVAWQNDDGTRTVMPSLEETSHCACFLVLDSMNMNRYYQKSPLDTHEALKCLESVAHLHAAAWENEQVLQTAQQRMARGSYHLSTRNPKELDEIQQSWKHFVKEFGDLEPELFSQPGIQNFGNRMYEISEYVSEQLTPSPTDKYATLAHGDFKAMNVFIPFDKKTSAVMIDFASTGVGMGMSDVAMHIIHAVRPSECSEGKYELDLVDGYLEALEKARRQYNTDATPYPRDVAMRQYRLACVDYIRFILGRFWKSATRESFDKKKDSMNTTLVNRDVQAAMAWIRKVDKYLEEFEEEKDSLCAGER